MTSSAPARRRWRSERRTTAARSSLVFNVKNGEVDGTDVSGLTVAAVADTPKVMSEGNWRLGVVIDAAASDEQAEKLGGVFSGALGGPMEALGPLVGENLGVERLPIEVHEDGLKHSIRIGDEVDFEIEDVVPVRGRERRAGEAHRHLPPGRLRADRLARDALEDQRLRHPVRGQGGLLRLRVLLGGLSAAESPARSPTGRGTGDLAAARRCRA